METLREVEFAEAEAMCEYIPEILYVMETSARENTNVEQVFMCLATELKVLTCIPIFILEVCPSSWVVPLSVVWSSIFLNYHVKSQLCRWKERSNVSAIAGGGACL